jgi:hypothetical protein
MRVVEQATAIVILLLFPVAEVVVALVMEMTQTVGLAYLTRAVAVALEQDR